MFVISHIISIWLNPRGIATCMHSMHMQYTWKNLGWFKKVNSKESK